MSYTSFFQNLNIPWLVGDPDGQAYWGAIGGVFDYYADLAIQATQARFPSYGPVDALPYISEDRSIIFGPHETTASKRTRLKKAWTQWGFGGSMLGMLVALEYAEFQGGVIVQQNGLYHTLSPQPVTLDLANLPASLKRDLLGWDPLRASKPRKQLLITVTGFGVVGGGFSFTISIAGATPIALTPTSSSGDQFYNYPVPGTMSWVRFPLSHIYNVGATYTVSEDGVVTTTGAASASDIEVQTVPWWSFDANRDFTSRWALIFPQPASVSPFVDPVGPAIMLPACSTTWARATFTSAMDGSAGNPFPSVSWNSPFGDTDYNILVSAPVVPAADAFINVSVASRTKLGCTLTANAGFDGSVDLVAYRDGDDPFGNFHDDDLARLRKVIRTWRRAASTCDGIYICTQGRMIGFPLREIGNANYTTIGPSSVVRYAP